MEMTLSTLSETQIEQFNQDGYLISSMVPPVRASGCWR